MLKKLYRSFSVFLSNRHLHIVKSLPYLKRSRRMPLERLDYVRLSCLELAAFEIYSKGIAGNVAELGVYKGDFSASINQVFNDRKLYLFDTFEGFHDNDKGTEVSNNYSDATQDFSDTSVEHVLAKMPNKELCIVRKVFFPKQRRAWKIPFA